MQLQTSSAPTTPATTPTDIENLPRPVPSTTTQKSLRRAGGFTRFLPVPGFGSIAKRRERSSARPSV